MLLYILIAIIVIITISFITYIIISNKKHSITVNELLEQMVHITNNKPTMNLNERLKFTNDLLDLIDDMLNFAIVNTKQFELFLDKKDKKIDFDNVIKNMSSNVFNGINKDVFIDKNNILSEKYLMSYIQKRATLLYLTYTANNDSIDS